MAIVAAATLQLSCARQEDVRSSSAWVKEVVDLQFEMSMHFLFMERMRDAVQDGQSDVSQCSPEKTRGSFAELWTRLNKLQNSIPDITPKVEIVDRLQLVKAEWSRLQDMQRSLWDNAQTVPGLPKYEMCLPASSMTGTRFRVESEFKKILHTVL